MNEMVERSARAAYEKFNENLIGCCEPPWEELEESFKARMLEAQRAAVETLREPTIEMLELGHSAARNKALVSGMSGATSEALTLARCAKERASWQSMIDEVLK